MPGISAASATTARMSRSSSRSRPTARSALAGRKPVAITGEAANARVHLLRAMHDAILIGIGTALSDDPLLTCRLPGMEKRSPVRVVLDRDLRLPAGSRLAHDGARNAGLGHCRRRMRRARRESALQRRRRRGPPQRGGCERHRSRRRAPAAGGQGDHPAAGRRRAEGCGVVPERRSGRRGGPAARSGDRSGRRASMRSRACRSTR